MPRIFQKWPFSWNMLHIVYQHSWKFNLETLLMPRIFSKWPHSWKMLSTIYQYSEWINLIGNCHTSILKIQLKHSCKCHVIEFFSLKKGGFLLVTCKTLAKLKLLTNPKLTCKQITQNLKEVGSIKMIHFS